MPVRSLGYLRLQSEDVQAWRTFAADFLGMMEAPGDNPDSLYYRIDDHPHRLVVSPGGSNDVEAVGFQVLDREELREMVAGLESAGTGVKWLTAEQCSDRKVTEAISFVDPAGVKVELFWGVSVSHHPVQTPKVSSFVTGDQGMGHVVVTTTPGEESYDLYTKVLGFRARNTMRLPAAPAEDGSPRFDTLWFLGCNPRHHTLGLLPMASPGRLVHFMVEAATLDDVGKAFDRAEKLGVPIMQTMGRHTNDLMVSFYVISPGGFAVEFGYDGLRITEDEPVYEITEGAFWGHKFINFPTL